MLYNATNIKTIFDKKKTLEGLLSKKSQNQTVKLPGVSLDYQPVTFDYYKHSEKRTNLTVGPKIGMSF